MTRAAVLIAVVTLPVAAASGIVPRFSVSGLKGWLQKPFEGRPHTRYTLEDDDGTPVAHAVCKDSASGLIWKGDVDLDKTPVLHWRWKISRLYPGIDEWTRAGDDFPARVYVVTGTEWLPWTIKSLSYVWSNGSRRGPRGVPYWKSPYTGQARMVAVRSGDDGVGRWQQESRDVRQDYRRVFGADVHHLGAVAVMTDCDDSHNHAQAWYGDLYFAAH